MNETVTGPVSKFIGEFKALTTKQWIGIMAALVISLALEMYMGAGCMIYFIIAIVLYMIPHILGVSSVSIKATVCVVFAVVAILIGTFAYGGVVDQNVDKINSSDGAVQNISYNEEDGTITFDLVGLDPGDSETKKTWYAYTAITPVSGISFGSPMMNGGTEVVYRETTDPKYSEGKTVSIVSEYDEATKQYTNHCTVQNIYFEKGNLYGLNVGYLEYPDEKGKIINHVSFMIDKGCDRTALCLSGSGYTLGSTVIIFFMILLFSALMRSSAEKSRKKMEAEGRLYPKGYGRCKNCGATVLPGEVNCRKCGTYIDVPEEMRPHKKDFFQCTECGAEVPSDATACPKCGAKFEGSETEVVREDGEVETSEDDMIACPGCDYHVPAGTEWCPKCGRMLKKE